MAELRAWGLNVANIDCEKWARSRTQEMLKFQSRLPKPQHILHQLMQLGVPGDPRSPPPQSAAPAKEKKPKEKKPKEKKPKEKKPQKRPSERYSADELRPLKKPRLRGQANRAP